MMNVSRTRMIQGSKALLGVIAIALMWGAGVRPLAAQASADRPKMEDVYKNIQVFKGQPAEEMLITMRFFRASLGVACTWCHMEPDDTKIGETAKLDPNASKGKPAWFADEPGREIDTPRKNMARVMVRMTEAINKQNFGGKAEVTCFTCHRGNLHPAMAYDSALVSPMNPAPPDDKSLSNMPVDPIIGKFIDAIGGEAALQKISTRITKGTVQFGPMIADRAAGRVPKPFDVEIEEQRPGMRALVTSEENGVLRATNGEKGWQQGRFATDPRHQPRDMRGHEHDNFKLEDPYFFATELKRQVSGMRVSRTENVDGKPAYVVVGRTAVLPVVQLYFDKESGMLVRVSTEAQGLIGQMPMIYDFGDFRAVDGVKVPFRWVSSDISEGQRYTYTITDAQQNVTVDARRFTRPPQFIVFFELKKKEGRKAE